MTSHRLSRPGTAALLLACFAGLAPVGCSSGSSRTDYYAARSVAYPAAAGDSSVISIGPGSADSAWTASLTLVPIDAGGLADNR